MVVSTGTITCGYTANTGMTSRTATIRVTAASGSPADVSVTQAGTPVQTLLSVTPASRVVAKDAGSAVNVTRAIGAINMPRLSALSAA